MPTNYTLKRRIGSVIRNAGTILAFKQFDDAFLYVTGVSDRASTSAAASALLALTVPDGIVVSPILSSAIFLASGSTKDILNQVGSASAGAVQYGIQRASASASTQGTSIATIYIPALITNTSRQIYWATIVSSGSIDGNVLTTMGWVDTRGRT
jgi:hypothetical protein